MLDTVDTVDQIHSVTNLLQKISDCTGVLMTVLATVDEMATSYLSQPGSTGSAPPAHSAPASDQEDGVMNLVNTSASQGYSLPRDQPVQTYFTRTFLSESAAVNSENQNCVCFINHSLWR